MRRTLRSHIPRSTRKRTRSPRTRRTGKRSNTEISHTNLLIQRLPQNTAQQNILRLNIQMHHALTVSKLHRIQNLHNQAQRQTDRQRTLRIQLLTQRTAMLKLHHQSQHAALNHHVRQRHNMRMRQRQQYRTLTHKRLKNHRVLRKLRAQNLRRVQSPRAAHRSSPHLTGRTRTHPAKQTIRRAKGSARNQAPSRLTSSLLGRMSITTLRAGVLRRTSRYSHGLTP